MDGSDVLLLITGHSRSGTKYMAQLMQSFGLRVRHESEGHDGISCWSWATNDIRPPWSPGQRKPYDHLIHVIRHPLAAIPSIAYTDGGECWQDHEPRLGPFGSGCCMSFHFRRFYTVQFPEWSHIDNAAMSYFGWTNLIQAQGPDLTVKVEEAPQRMAEYLALIRKWSDPKRLPSSLPSEKTNTRPHLDIPMSEYRPEIQGAIRRFCKRWGYDIGHADAT